MPLPKKKKKKLILNPGHGSDLGIDTQSPRRFLLWLSFHRFREYQLVDVPLHEPYAQSYLTSSRPLSSKLMDSASLATPLGMEVGTHSACRCACVSSWMVLVMTQHDLSEIHHLRPIFSWAVWQIVKPPVWSKCCHMNPEGTTQQRWHWSFLSDTFRFAILHLFCFLAPTLFLGVYWSFLSVMKVQKGAVVYAWCFASVASRVDEYRVQSSTYPPIRQWGKKYKVLPLSIYQHLGNNREAGEAVQP